MMQDHAACPAADGWHWRLTALFAALPSRLTQHRGVGRRSDSACCSCPLQALDLMVGLTMMHANTPLA